MLRLVLGLTLMILPAVLAEDKHAIPPARGPLPAGVREVSIDEADKVIRERADVAVIDVRSAAEFAEHGHLPRAQLVDYFRMDFVAAIGTLKIDPAKPCLLYCALGGRARRAAEILAKAGYKEILLPKGGFKAWKDAGKPVEGAPKKSAP